MSAIKKFTLVELLVVIAIIGILVSLLLPSISKARTRTVETLCVNNLKQIYIGCVNYIDENDGFMPRGTNFDTSKHWPRYIYPFMSSDTFPSSAAGIVELMETSVYSRVIYSPVVTGLWRGGKVDVHNYGRSDYALNRFFTPTNGSRNKRLDNAVGKIEPLMVPIQSPANPDLDYTTLTDNAKAAAYYYVNETKTTALYVDGGVRMLSIAEGSQINGQIQSRSDLE